MQPIISIVGKSESGKTTLLEALIAELRKRGHRIAVMKHTGNEYEFDTTNKDTWRFARAGSEVSAIGSGERVAVFKKLENRFGPEELSLFAGDCDLILAEGFKQSSYPRIEVHRKEQGEGLLSPPEQLLAVVTDEPLEVKVPQFARSETIKIADLIEQRVIAQPREPELDLFINGTYVAAAPYLRELMARTLMAMVSGIKESGEIKSVYTSIRRRP